MQTLPAPLRRLGRSDILLKPMALGCYSMSNAYGRRDDAESVQVIQAALEQGVRCIDTADFYGWGHNEELVGRALEGRRGEAVLSTKFGYVRDGAGYRVDGRPAHVRAALEASLKRLKTDHVDLLFQHRLDPEVPIEDTVGAMADLVREGKVGNLGLCEVSSSTLRKACAVHPIAAVQAEYSLWTRDVEHSGLDRDCRQLQVTLMPFSPLGRGMLTGRLRSLDDLAADDVRRKYPRFSPENFAWNVALVDRLAEKARALGCSLAELALAWLYHVNRDLVAVCGADTLAFLAENIGAMDVVLSEDDLAEISALFSPDQVAGERYDAAAMKKLQQSRA